MGLESSSIKCTHGLNFRCKICWAWPKEQRMMFEQQAPEAPPLIVKVQLSLATNAEYQQCLIYNQNRQIMVEFDCTPEIKKSMGHKPKRYFLAAYEDGVIKLGDEVGEQPW